MKKLYKEIKFKKFSDGRGDLIPLEFGKDFPNADIPFDVKRCFFISPKHDEIRAKHAHKWVEQVIICLEGSFDLVLKDGKGNEETLTLSNYYNGIHIPKLVWNELKNFSSTCKILVLASDHYIPEEYINKYNDFLEQVKKDS